MTRPDSRSCAVGDELRALSERADGFHYMATLTRETSPEPGLGIGRIDATLLASALAKLPHAPKLTFICGANAFVETAADLPVGLGIPPERIRTERYGG